MRRKSRKGVEKELSKDSRLFACISSYAIKAGKKFRAKTSLEELFFFFKVDQNGLVSNYYCQRIIYSLKEIFLILLKKKK